MNQGDHLHIRLNCRSFPFIFVVFYSQKCSFTGLGSIFDMNLLAGLTIGDRPKELKIADTLLMPAFERLFMTATDFDALDNRTQALVSSLATIIKVFDYRYFRSIDIIFSKQSVFDHHVIFTRSYSTNVQHLLQNAKLVYSKLNQWQVNDRYKLKDINFY